jgi:hypothetical protein
MADKVEARPFISFGKWVTDCPYDGCYNAKEVGPGEGTFVCDTPPDRPGGPPTYKGACGRTAPIAWPDDVGTRMARVSDRPENERSEVVPGSPQDREPDPAPIVANEEGDVHRRGVDNDQLDERSRERKDKS